MNTINIEGIKGNPPFLISLAKKQKIICVQKTWLWSFEKDVISKIIPDYESFTRCADHYDNIPNFQAPRGKGGVAIVWPKEWSSKIVKLDEGNERIIAIEMQCSDEKFCIVNAYMPTLNLPKSRTEYQEHIDILHSIVSKYKNSHKVILCGDFNATLLETRDNPHDSLFKKFVSEVGLMNKMNCIDSTFFSHNGKSTSQIDYILTKNIKKVTTVKIQDFRDCNTFSHVHVTFEYELETALICGIRNKTGTHSILLWEKINKDTYLEVLDTELTKNFNQCTTTDSLNSITKAINQATSKAVPVKTVKPKGPKFKLSPQVKDLMKESKNSLIAWKQAGKPTKKHKLSEKKKLAPKTLRKQLRKEEAIRKQNFLSELMSDPSDKNFYKLIKRNQNP